MRVMASSLMPKPLLLGCHLSQGLWVNYLATYWIELGMPPAILRASKINGISLQQRTNSYSAASLRKILSGTTIVALMSLRRSIWVGRDKGDKT